MPSKECIDFCVFLLQDTFCPPQVALGDAATEQITDITAKALRGGWHSSWVENILFRAQGRKCMISMI